MWETSVVFLKEDKKKGCAVSNEKHLVKKIPNQLTASWASNAAILQSLPAAPYLVAKMHMLHGTPTEQYRDNREKLITVILQDEK